MTLIPAGIFMTGLFLGFLADCAVEREASGGDLSLRGRTGSSLAGDQIKKQPDLTSIWNRWREKVGKAAMIFAFGTISLILYRCLGWGVQTECFLFLCCFLQMAVLMEAQHRYFPGDYFTGLVLAVFPPLLIKPVEELSGIVPVFLIIGGVLYGIFRLTHGGIEKQDAGLTAFMTLFLGVELSLTALFLTTLLCGIAGIVMLVVNFTNRKKTLPFSPFLMAGVLIAIVLHA